MNSKAAALFVILCAVVYFMFGMIVYQFLKPDIAIQRDVDHMNCTAPDTSGDKSVCLIFDGVIPIFVISILAAAAGYITSEAIK